MVNSRRQKRTTPDGIECEVVFEYFRMGTEYDVRMWAEIAHPVDGRLVRVPGSIPPWVGQLPSESILFQAEKNTLNAVDRWSPHG